MKPPVLRVLVCGSRDFADRFHMREALAALPRDLAITIIHGGARGADALADKAARELGFAVEEYQADWHKHGRAAGPLRNQRMLDEGKPDRVIAFPLPGSIGTWDMVRRARKAGIAVDVIEVA